MREQNIERIRNWCEMKTGLRFYISYRHPANIPPIIFLKPSNFVTKHESKLKKIHENSRSPTEYQVRGDQRYGPVSLEGATTSTISTSSIPDRFNIYLQQIDGNPKTKFNLNSLKTCSKCSNSPPPPEAVGRHRPCHPDERGG